jgi:hypothetical protein
MVLSPCARMKMRPTPSEPAPLFPLGADTLRVFSDDAFDPLVGVDALARLTRCAEVLSIEAHTVCFETRLAAGDGRIDLAFALLREHGVTRWSSRMRARSSAASWERVDEFFRSWVEPESRLGFLIPFLCVAFDLDERIEPERIAWEAPSLSLCVDPGFFTKRLGVGPAPSATPEQLVDLAATCQSRLTGEELHPEHRACLRRLLGANGVEAKHLSLMLSRPGSPLKIDVRLAFDHLPVYLAHVGWPENADTIVKRLRQLVPWGGHVQLNLWVDRGAATTLDVEVFAGNPEASPQDRVGFLDRLVGSGLASREKAAVLAGISGRALAERGGLSVGKNWYVKLRFSGEELADAKAYVALMPRPFLRREVAEADAGLGQA